MQDGQHEDFLNAPLLEMARAEFESGRDGVLIDLAQGDFFTFDFLSPLVDATALWKAINNAGDIGIFTGGIHGFRLEHYLEQLGFTREGVANEHVLKKVKKILNGGSISYLEYIEIKSHAAPHRCFEWMILAE